jgi:hypothetical protein
MPVTVPSRAEVLSAIRASGYPLELKVAQQLRARDYTVSQSWNYFDEKAQTSREVDVAAHRDVEREDGTLISFHLLAECKMKTSGVVGFRSVDDAAAAHRSYMDFDCTSLHPEEFYFARQKDDFVMLHASRVFAWGLKAFPPREFTTTQFAFLKNRPQRQQSPAAWMLDQQDAYSEHVIPLCRGYSAYHGSEMHVPPEAEAPRLHFATLLFILEGPVWLYAVGGTRKSLRNAKVFSYYRHLEGPYGAGVFRIDFVQYTHLTKYLDWLAREQSKVISIVDDLQHSPTESLRIMNEARATVDPAKPV